jgi:catechol 2,3-dioxygenase-like lactoylglutathione lyase family enzyme
MKETPLTLHLHTTMLLVKNLERSQAWYEEKLGMTVVRHDGFYKAVTLISPNFNRVTIWEPEQGDIPRIPVPPASYGVFVSDDLEQDRRTLVARGVAATDIDVSFQGVHLFWISDPDGHRFCVVQFMPE